MGEYNPTSYRISTITATGSMNTELDLDVLFEGFNKMINESGVGKDDTIVTGLAYTEYGKKKSNTYYTGFSKKFLIQRRKENVSKRFDNQLTVIYKYNVESLMNIKIFNNGNVQITGVKQIEHGKLMIDILIDLVKQVLDDAEAPDTTPDAPNAPNAPNAPSPVIDVSKLKNVKYKVALINSDFKVGFEIKRDRLFSVLINKYENKCSFEPCIYPGVKIQYFWNDDNKKRDGVCCCKEQCFAGKGDGNGDGNCKKITIAVFQSGCIIITGAQTTAQIDDAYHFICSMLLQHIDYVKKVIIASIIPQEVKTQNKVKVILKKSLITYPHGLPVGHLGHLGHSLPKH